MKDSRNRNICAHHWQRGGKQPEAPHPSSNQQREMRHSSMMEQKFHQINNVVAFNACVFMHDRDHDVMEFRKKKKPSAGLETS